MQRRTFCALLPSLAAAADASSKAFPAAQGWKPLFPAGSLAAWVLAMPERNVVCLV